MSIPCCTENTPENLEKYSRTLKKGWVIVLNHKGLLEDIPEKSVELLRLSTPDLKVLHGLGRN